MSQRRRVPAPRSLARSRTAQAAQAVQAVQTVQAVRAYLASLAALASLPALAVGVFVAAAALETLPATRSHTSSSVLLLTLVAVTLAVAAARTLTRRRRLLTDASCGGSGLTSLVGHGGLGDVESITDVDAAADHRPWHGQPPGPAALDTFDPSHARRTIDDTPHQLRALAAGSDLRRQADALVARAARTCDTPPAGHDPAAQHRLLSDTEVLARTLVLAAQARITAVEEHFDLDRARTVVELLPDALAATGHSDSHHQAWALALRDGARGRPRGGTAPGGHRWLQVAQHEALELLTLARSRQHRTRDATT